MNVLDHYNKNQLVLSDPLTLDEDTYFCKFSYNNMPFVIKTSKICYIKGNHAKYINVSLTSKDYLVWFETFYQDCIQLFYEKSGDWFEEPLELDDLEFSFINPLKSNIRDNCFDVQCIIDSNRLNINDSNENMRGLDSISDSKVVPTFHIKGIKFNSKHFMFEIELVNIYVILDTPEPIVEPSEIKPVLETVEPHLEIQKVENAILDEMDEINIKTDNLEDSKINLDENNFLKIYEMINSKVKDNIVEHLRNIFIEKKIKKEVDLTEMVDDEDI
jgi:hypothetical protein